MTSARFYYQDANAPIPNRPRNLGVAALIERDGKLLLERRADCGRWSLIGGSIEANETLGQGLVREIYEETGLTVEAYTLFGTFSDPSRIAQYPDGNVLRLVTLAYRVTVDTGAPLCSRESMSLAWFTPDELRTLDIVETHRHIVHAFLTGADLVLE